MTPLVVLVWEAADWPLVRQYIDDGRLPNLSALLHRGVGGPLSTVSPSAGWSALTTLATGSVAAEHGILGPVDLEDGQAIPVSSRHVRKPYFWQIAARAGLSAGVLNWPLTYPVDGVTECVLSEPFFRSILNGNELLPPPPASAIPEEWRANLSELRIHAADIEPAELLAFVPLAAEIDQDQDGRLSLLAVKLAETISTQNAAVWCLQKQPWDLFTVRFSALESLGRVFGRYLPHLGPQTSADAAEFKLYSDVLVRFYELLDLTLGHLVGVVGSGTSVLVVSPHGQRYQRLRRSPSLQTERDVCRPQGFLCASGPAIKPEQALLGASVLDVVPSILRLCGLEEGCDMVGRPLAEIFAFEHRRSAIATWGSCHEAPTVAADPEVLIGLLAEHAPAVSDDVSAIALERELARAASLAETGRSQEALKVLQSQAVSSGKEHAEYLRLLAHLLLDHGLQDDFETLMTGLMRSGGSEFDRHLLLARLCSLRGEHEQALDNLFDALARSPKHPTLHVFVGEEYRRLHRPDEALKAFNNALKYDAENVRAHLGKAEALLDQRDYPRAVDAALLAIACRFNTARSHMLLGKALEGLDDWQQAVDAYQTSIKYAPGLLESHRALVRLYDADHLDQPALKNHHQDRFSQLTAASAMARHH